MAELLKRQYSLHVLKVELDPAAHEGEVRLSLEGRNGPDYETFHQWHVPSAALGLPDRVAGADARGRGPHFRFPRETAEDVARLTADRAGPGTPLWLHLVRPYGYLGLVPWEELLAPSVHRPMLRLPDYLALPPLASTEVLDVALCASTPTAKVPFALPPLVAAVARTILRNAARPTLVHVFVDGTHTQDLRGELRQQDVDPGMVHVYDPREFDRFRTADAGQPREGPDGRITNPWLRWMRDTLRNRSVDVVQFLTHGYFSLNQGSVALAEHPLRNEGTRTAGFVGPAELLTFLSQTGAWSAVFSSPPGDSCQLGLRHLAETLGQSRPGPAVLHDVERDRSLRLLGDVYGFLYAPTLAPAPLLGPSGFAYCHPSRVPPREGPQGFAIGNVPDQRTSMAWPAPAVEAPTPVGDAFLPGPAAVWRSAAARYFERRSFELNRLRAPKGSGPANHANERQAKRVQFAMQEIKNALERAERPRGRVKA